MKVRFSISMMLCALAGCGTNTALQPEREPEIVPGCSDSCDWASDGVCDDGGEGAAFSGCDYGTDCADCGPREGWTPPKPGTCQTDSDCDDDDARCVHGGCVNDPTCGEEETCVGGTCVQCVADWECDDGLFCNGWEECADGICVAGGLPCDDEECDEDTHECFATPVSTVDEILDASWLVVVRTQDGLYAGSGSAFSVGDNLLATNAHVVEFAASACRLGGSVTVYQHETGAALTMSAMWIHPDYTDTFSPDVGVIEVAGTLPSALVVASDTTLHSLQVFDDVRLSGFPGELAEINLIRPRATMLSGHITAMRPFDQSQAATSLTAMLIQHDMPTTRGTSGSAMVNESGEVIALNNSGFLDGQSNFAIRADALSQLLAWVRSGWVSPVDTTNPCLGVSCDDGLFCNGQEICVDGTCIAGVLPCGAEKCDEDAQTCVGIEEIVIGDGAWIITWETEGWIAECLWVDSGIVTHQSIGCGEWVDVVDMEILYLDGGAGFGGLTDDGTQVIYIFLPIADEQFSAGYFVDDEMIATGLMTR